MNPRRDFWVVATVVFLAALALRGLYLYELAATPFLDERQLIADAAYYDMRAREIATGGLLGDAPAFLSPFYCLVLGVVYGATVPTVLAAKLFQAVLGALSCVLLYAVGCRFFSEGTGRLAAAILVLYGPHLYYGGLLLPSTLVVFLHLALLLVLARPPGPGGAITAGVLIGLAVLTKSNAILLLPAVLLVWWLLRRDEPIRVRSIAGALLVAATFATILPVTVVNYAVSGRFLLVATTSGSNLLKGNGPTATGTHAFLPLGTQFTGLRAHLDHEVDPAVAVEQSRVLAAGAIRYAVGHPLRTAGLAVKKLALLVNARELGIRDHYDFARTRISLLGRPLPPFWLVVPLGLTGLLFCWPERRRLAMPIAMLAVQALSFVLVFVLARYRLVAVALLAPFAARQLLWFVDRFRESAWKPLAPRLAVLAAFVALAFLPFSEFPRDRGFADQSKFLADRQREEGHHAEAVEHYRAALDASWQDARRAQPLRWESMLGQVHSLVALDRGGEALAVVDALAAELDSAFPGRATPLQAETEKLRRSLEER